MNHTNDATHKNETVEPTAVQAEKQTTATKTGRVLISSASALGAGLIASLLAVVLMGILRLVAGIPTPVELFGDYVLKRIDVGTFIRFLVAFSPHPKTGPLGWALLAMIGIGTLLGLLYAALVRVDVPANGVQPAKREWLTATGFAFAMSLLAIVLFWDELRQNLFGLPLNWSVFVAALGLIADFAFYGAILALIYRCVLPQISLADRPVQTQKRRQLLARVGIATLGVLAGGSVYGLLRVYLSKYTSYDGSGPAPENGFTAPITPNKEHYTVTKNTIDPAPNSSLWRLEVSGLVKTPGAYTYDEIQQLPAVSRPITLECISNGLGSPRLMSTAVWHGVSLQTLLEQHGGALPEAKFVTFYSVDGYNISLPLDEVLAADTLLAWRMNEEILSNRHGFPLRVVIPERYGEESPKWLTRVELKDHFVHGLYSNQGWYNGPLHTTSRIDRPGGHIPHGQPVEIGGIAFSGNRGIQKVEVSVDGGKTWQRATVEPPLSKDSWVLWSSQWTPAEVGIHTLVVRATDGKGEVQTSRRQGPVPNGATGYHMINVEVV